MKGLVVVALLCGALGQVAEAPGQDQVDFANGLFQRGFFEEAAEEYRNYLSAYPEGPHAGIASFRLGVSENSLKDYERALEAFDKAIALGGEGVVKERATLGRGEALHGLKRLDEATQVFESLTKKDVDPAYRVRALYSLGKVNYERKAPELAIKAFRALIDQYPKDSFATLARYQLAYVYLSRQEFEKAAAEFSSIAGSDADASLKMESRFRAAETYDKIGWFEAAALAYKKVLEDYPGTDYAQRAELGQTWSLYHAGKHGEAASAASGFLQRNPASPHAVATRYLWANCLQKLEEFDNAIAQYTEVIEKGGKPKFVSKAQHKIAWCLYLAGRPVEAKASITTFLKGTSDRTLVGDAAFLMGTILFADKNYEDAYEEFRLIVEKYKDSKFAAEALYKLGECLSKLNRASEAEKVFERFAKKYPSSPLAEQAILRVGDAEFFRASFDEAIAKYKSILASSPSPGVERETIWRMAVAYHNKRDFKTSAETFGQVLKKYPEDPRIPEARLRIGDYLLKEVRDPVAALAQYEKALQADPKGKYAGKALRGQALARYESKDIHGACAAFLRVMKEHPSVALKEKTYLWVGQKYFDQKKWNEAALSFESLLKGATNYAAPERVVFKIGECREAAGQAKEALKAYGRVKQLAPASSTSVDAAYRMGKLEEGLGNVEAATALYEEAAGRGNSDTSARARFRLGELYEAKKDYDAAARSYMRIAILFLHEELSPESLLRAALCFEKQENLDRAVKTYEELVISYPNSKQAGKASKRLAELVQ